MEKLDKMWNKINRSVSDSERETLNRWHGALMLAISDMRHIDPGNYRSRNIEMQKELHKQERLAIREIDKYLSMMPWLGK